MDVFSINLRDSFEVLHSFVNTSFTNQPLGGFRHKKIEKWHKEEWNGDGHHEVSPVAEARGDPWKSEATQSMEHADA